MKSTIGEIVDIINPYSINIEMIEYSNHPFLKARIRHNENYTAFFLYVLQVEEHQYITAYHRDDVNGNRFFPYLKDYNQKKLISEKDLIKLLLGKENNNDILSKYNDVNTVLSPFDFIIHFLSILYENKIIPFNIKKVYQINMIEWDFITKKMRKALEESFHLYDYEIPTIENLIYIILVKRKSINLEKLKSKEIHLIVNKLKSLGFIIEIQSRHIINLKFIKGV